MPGQSARSAFHVMQSVSIPVNASATIINNAPVLTSGIPAFVINYHRPIRLAVQVRSTVPVLDVSMSFRPFGAASFQTTSFGLAAGPSAQSTLGVASLPPVPGGKTVFVEYALSVSFQTAGGPRTITRPPAFLEVRDKMVGTLDAAGGRLTAEDGDPADAASSVLAPDGAFKAPTQVTIDPLDALSGSFPAPAAAPSAAPSPFNGAGAAYLIESEPAAPPLRPVTVTLLYSDQDRDGLVDGTLIREQDLTVYWWDGLQQRFVTKGSLDTQNKTVTFSTRHLGLFILGAGGAAPATYRPRERIITPNGDMVNDAAVFDGVGPGDRIVIFDVSGRVVRDLSDSNAWDGLDASGRAVESGVYVYQVHAAGRVFSGTISVAK